MSREDVCEDCGTDIAPVTSITLKNGTQKTVCSPCIDMLIHTGKVDPDNDCC